MKHKKEISRPKVTTVSIRYCIQELTDEGHLIDPEYREQYCYHNSRAYDPRGYESLEAAVEAIKKHAESLVHGMPWGYNDSFFVIPKVTITVE